MLKIRMQRTGRINQPSYRIVVTERARAAKTGNIVEKVGTYDPRSKQRNLNADRIKYWLSVGAQATPTMHNMLISVGIIEGKKINVLPKKSPPKADAAEAAAPATEAKPVEEVPAPELNDDVKPDVADAAPEENKG